MMRGGMWRRGWLQIGKQQTSEEKVGGVNYGATRACAKHGRDRSRRTGVSYVRAAAMNAHLNHGFNDILNQKLSEQEFNLFEERENGAGVH